MGESRTHDADGDYYYGSPEPHWAYFEVTTTVLDDNASVEVPYGTVDGCLEVEVEYYEESYSVPL
ncbi:MAG: hypothetical protein M5R36_23280 [Deltaproteobacteria bacterium]|nr:hypothetical protein [Deltaproteobacteria bacterium]